MTMYLVHIQMGAHSSTMLTHYVTGIPCFDAVVLARHPSPWNQQLLSASHPPPHPSYAFAHLARISLGRSAVLEMLNSSTMYHCIFRQFEKTYSFIKLFQDVEKCAGVHVIASIIAWCSYNVIWDGALVRLFLSGSMWGENVLEKCPYTILLTLVPLTLFLTG